MIGINDKEILKNLMINKERLITKGIYSTPTFIVNGKVLDNKYAIHYLEDVIAGWQNLLPVEN